MTRAGVSLGVSTRARQGVHRPRRDTGAHRGL